MKIQCIAVDDEPLALQQIAGYIRKTPFLELVAECRSAMDALTVIQNNPVQLIFLDISMPDMSGMEFAKSLTGKPYIVFTTAYSEYAVEGFRVNAVDYLLKPVTLANFLKAANKVKDLIELTATSQKESLRATADYLFVKSEYKLVRIVLDDIKYIESQHEYLKIFLINTNPVKTLLSMKTIEEQLPKNRFMRVHRSFIVNLSRITVIERNRIVFDGKVYIPISDQYKEKFQEYIDGNFA